MKMHVQVESWLARNCYEWNAAFLLSLGLYQVPSRIWKLDAHYAKSYFSNRDVIRFKIEFIEPIDLAALGYVGSREQVAMELRGRTCFPNEIIMKRCQHRQLSRSPGLYNEEITVILIYSVI